MARKNRFYLDCPYAEKDEAKSLGARWDLDARKWFVPNDVDRNHFKKWWPTMKGEESVEDVENFCNG